MNFTGVKVFSATKARELEDLGDQVTRWIRDNPAARIIDKIVTTLEVKLAYEEKSL